MNKRILYEEIKDSVVYGMEEYIDEEGYNSSQAAGRILEEDWREVNYSSFTKSSYFLNIALESFKRNEIADFIYDRLDEIIIVNIDRAINVSKEELDSYQRDLEFYQYLKQSKEYRILENTYEGKSRVEYLLNLGTR